MAFCAGLRWNLLLSPPIDTLPLPRDTRIDSNGEVTSPNLSTRSPERDWIIRASPANGTGVARSARR